MKCTKCNKDNIISANYCKYCGYQFNKKEKEKAKRKTLVGKIEFLENAYEICTLKKITGHIIYKIATLIIVLLIGITLVCKNGTNVKILKSDNYKIKYNSNENVYYLLVNTDTVKLNLYVPNNNTKLEINHYDSNNNILKNTVINDNNIVLDTNYNEDYYVIENDKDDIKLFVYRTEVKS